MSAPSYLSLLQQGPVTASTMTTSTLSAPQINLGSTMVTLGSGAAATKPTTNTSGSYAAGGWITSTPAGQAAAKSVKMSSTGQYQLVVSASAVYVSSDSGATWATVSGLPAGITWLGGSVSGSGQYMTLTEINGVWLSSDYGVTFAMTKAGAPYAWLKFENNVTDAMGNSTVTATATSGSIGYVASSTKSSGSYAVNLTNTPSGTAQQYLRGPWTPTTNNTISFWFNPQSITSTYQVVFSAAAGYLLVYIRSSNALVAQFPTGSGTAYATIDTPFLLVQNTWYYVTIIFQTNGICSFYVNNTLIGTVTNSGGYGTITQSNVFGLGTYDNGLTLPFNGYIDDLKIYNTVAPVNYLQSAVSGSGQYLIASAQSGHLTTSANYGATWSNQGQVAGSGQMYVTPNQDGLSGLTWTNRGINWTASASSSLGGGALQYPYSAFNNISASTTTYSGVSAFSWAPTGTSYSTSGNSSGVNTIVAAPLSQTLTGDYLQIQSSVPLVFSNYQFGNGGTVAYMPKTYYFLGSNDGTTWYPIHYGSVAAQPSTTGKAIVSGTIVVNQSGSQTMGSSTVTVTTYTTSANSYTYFRIVCISTFSAGASYLEIGQLVANFQIPPGTGVAGTTNLAGGALSLSHSGQYALATVGNAAGSVMPNMSGLASSTWTQGGVGWTATSSSNYSNLLPYGAFNNYYGSSGVYSWASAANYNAAGVYNNTYSTSVTGIGTVYGDWIQLQISVPLVMQSYSYACGGYTGLPGAYYIVGSLDGITWYPVQRCVMTTNPLTGNYHTCTSYLLVNYTGTQTISGDVTGSGTFTSYSYTTQAFSYYRMICTAGYSTCGTLFELGEWYINFQSASAVSSNFGTTWTGLPGSALTDNALALSGSGKYALGTSSVTPFSRLTLDNTAVDAQGGLTAATGAGTVTYSSLYYKVGTHSAYFNNTSPGVTASNYLSYSVPSILNKPSAQTLSYWVYITSLPPSPYVSVPVAFTDGTNVGTSIFIMPNGNLHIACITSSSITATDVLTSVNLTTNTWYHLSFTFIGGSFILYCNGQSVASLTLGGILCVRNTGANITNMLIGT